MSEKFEILVEGKRYSVEIKNMAQNQTEVEPDPERDRKIESTRNFVLTLSTMCAALTAFLMPVILKSNNTYAAKILSVAIACYLLTILMGLVHVLVLYYQELYSNKNEASGDILEKPKRWLLKKHGELKKHQQYALVTSHMVVRGKFTLKVVGILFLLGLLLTLYFVYLTVHSII